MSTALLVLSGGLVVGGLVVPSPQPPPLAPYRSLDPADPVLLLVPSVDIEAPVVPVALSEDRVLDPPQDVVDVGWWDRSAQPGSETGSTVIAGHSVHTGGGALDPLRGVRRGAVVDVRTAEGTMRYLVQRKKVYDKDELAVNAVSIFGQESGRGRLVLVSCTDWDGSGYASNVVVYAVALGEPRELAGATAASLNEPVAAR
ncbi:MAG: class F sortase [Actinobacteria bacterium]|nr:class F sortase [Actinomycetota bacterium]